jgi:hypothetical protein
MASTPFWYVASGNGQGGSNSTIPIPTPNTNTPTLPTGSDQASSGAQTVDLSPYFSMFGFNPGNTPATLPSISNPNVGGLFGSIQAWVNQNPGTAVLLGIFLFVLAGNSLSSRGKS